MSNPFDEKVSCFLDNELEATEREQVYKHLKQDNELQQRWGRYCLIQEALKKNCSDNPKHDLASRVSRALESEPLLLAPSNEYNKPQTEQPNVVQPDFGGQVAAFNSNSKPSYGIAAAAALAAFSIIGVLSFNNSEQVAIDGVGGELAAKQTTESNSRLTPDNSTQVLVTTNRPQAPTQIPQMIADPSQWNRIDQVGNIPLDNYIERQEQQNSANSGNGGQQARIVNFEGNAAVQSR